MSADDSDHHKPRLLAGGGRITPGAGSVVGVGFGAFGQRLFHDALDMWNHAAAQSLDYLTDLVETDRFIRWRSAEDSMYGRRGVSPAYDAFIGKADPLKAMKSALIPPMMMEWARAEVQRQIRDNPRWKDWMHSPQAASLHRFFGTVIPGRSALHASPWNHQFLTEDAHGQLRAVRVEEIDALFPRGKKGNGFAHIVMVPNHVIAESEKDIRELTHGVEALIRDSQGQTLPLTRVNGHIENKAGKTLILFACDTERNPFLNSASLLKRLNELEQVAATGKPDRFQHASPGAIRMAGLILRQMAQNPEDVEILNAPPYVQVHAQTLQLREHPERVAQHFQLIGYSKGGNVVSDAMRYLVTLLADEKGNPRVPMAEGHSVRNLVRNIACMSIAALEVKMAEHYKKLGVRRVSFNNEHDLISNHMDFESSWADHKWKIKGVKERLGHAPADALGTREGDTGYVLDDPEVRRVMKESFAPVFGKAAISSLSFKHDTLLKDDHTVLLGTAAGTPDELLMQHAGKIKKALQKAGLHNVRVEDTTDHNDRAFFIRAKEPIRTSRQAILKLRAGFADLRANAEGLVVADAILNHTLAEQLWPARLDREMAVAASKPEVAPTEPPPPASLRPFADRVTRTMDVKRQR